MLGRKIRYLMGKETSQDYVEALRSRGIKIGKKTVFFEHRTNQVDVQRPWLITIGDYCKICRGVIILAHDYSRSVLRRVYGDVVGEARKTVIGDNVFIGMNAIILMGSHVGNNVIIGAGSVVHGVIPDNVVVAGNPAKVLYTLDEYYQKRKQASPKEAVLCARDFYHAYGRKPTIEEMGAFFPLYLERSREALASNHIRTNLSGDEEEDVIDKFLNSPKLYEDYEAFLKTAFPEET